MKSTFNKIPLYSHEIYIDSDGTMFHNDSVITLMDFNEITGLNVTDIFVLVLLTYRNIFIPPVYWQHLSVICSLDEPTPESMILQFNKPIESLEYSGYYYIPNFSNYLITREGILMRRYNESEVTPSHAETDYFTFRMTNNDGKTSNILRHRVMALAFLKYDKDPDLLTVNHIDGIRGNDVISNLEWCSLLENIEHYNRQITEDVDNPVEVYDSVNNTVNIFSNYQQAATHYSTGIAIIKMMVNSAGSKQFRGLQARKYPSNGDWPVEVQDLMTYNNDKRSFEVTFPDGKIIRCRATEAASYCGVTRTSMQRLLREGRNKGKTEVLVRKLSPDEM